MAPKKRKVLVKPRLNKDVVLQVRVDRGFHKAIKTSQNYLKIKKNGDFLRDLLFLGLSRVRNTIK